MARTRNQTRTAEPQTVTVNAMDRIVARLNTISGIEFARDAWVNQAPDNYGVVELSGEARQLWADGHLVDSAWNVIVTAYVGDGNDDWPEKVQERLQALEDAGKCDLTHTIGREFDYETGKVRWTWTLYMYGTLTRTEEVPAAQTGT